MRTTNLTLHLSSLSNLGRETSLDRRHGSSRSARVAGDERETVLSLAQLGIGRSAGLARHVLDDVFSQHVLQLLGLETTLDDQPRTSVDGTAGTQLGE